MKNSLGILGGMGPLATIDFAQKIIQLTPAERDQDHMPLLIHSVPQIPDRTSCLMHNTESPLQALSEGLDLLVDSGAQAIAIPCNTAHYWHPALVKKSPVPIFHITEACVQPLRTDRIKQIALMATDGTLAAGFYPEILNRSGIEVYQPDQAIQQQVMLGIYQVKSGKMQEGANTLNKVYQKLLDNGAERVILGCTEIPLALNLIKASNLQHGIDATSALASYCVDWYLDSAPKEAA